MFRKYILCVLARLVLKCDLSLDGTILTLEYSIALNGQVIGLGAGQQSRIHCTRLAGDKADNWWMRFHERALNLKWKKGTKRPDKSNAIDMLCSGQLPKSEIEKQDYEKNFDKVPKPFTHEEREEWLSHLTGVALSSDAFASHSHGELGRLLLTFGYSFHSSTMFSELADLESSTLLVQQAVRQIRMCLLHVRSLISPLLSKACGL